MSRDKGLASFSANFEAQIASPIDARNIVDNKADLTTASIWLANDGVNYAYKGMVVSVHSDITPSNNGLYRLLDLPVTVEANWEKLQVDSTYTTYDYIDFTTSLANPAYEEGRVFYDDTKKALSYYNDESDIIVNIGQELLIRVYNNTGATIPNGSAVYPSGTFTDMITIGLANAGDKEKCRLVGITTHEILDGSSGFVTKFGEVSGIDTSIFSVGNVLYLGNNDGQITDVKPVGSSYITQIGAVKVVDVNGSVLVDINTTEFTVEASSVTGFSHTDQATLSFNDATRTLTINPVGYRNNKSPG